MKRITIFLLILLFSFTLYSSVSSSVKILSVTKDFITIEVVFNDYRITNTDEFTILSSDNWEFNADIGAPALPICELKAIIPPNGYADYTILSKKIERVKIDNPVIPVKKPIEAGITHDFLNIINEEKYKNFSKVPINLGEKSRFRYYSFIPIRITPVILEDNYLIIYKKILFKVSINGNKAVTKDYKDGFNDLAESIFINYQTGKNWQSKPDYPSLKLDLSASEFWYKFFIKNNSENLITRQALEILPEFFDIASIRLFKIYKTKKDNYLMKEIPVFIKDNEVYFINQIEDNRKRNGSTVFYITFGGVFRNKPLRLDEFPTKKVQNRIERLFVVNKLQDRGDRADCIIVYPQIFASIANELAAFQNDEMNVSTFIVTQESIVDQYTGGYADFVAIKNYLRDTFTQWEPSPEYVILLGGGTYEGLIGFDDITLQEWYNLHPKNKILTDGSGEDDRFVIFNIKYPQMSISRFPFKSASEFDRYIQRMKKYYTDLPKGWWQNKMVLLADDELHAGGYEGANNTSNFDHSLYAQKTQNNIKNTFLIDKIMAINYPLDEYNNKPEVTKELIKRLNEGRLIWYFIGHGNHDVMGDESYFIGSDIEKLYNEEHLPLLVAGSCNVGEFDNPNFDSIGERILVGEHGGAIASLTASRGCGPLANYEFILIVLKATVEQFYNIGKSVLRGKMISPNSSNSLLFNLFGNPLLYINPPKEKGNIAFSGSQGNSINKRQLVDINGNYTTQENYTDGDLIVFESPKWVTYSNVNFIINDSTYYTVEYTKEPKKIYHGKVSIDKNQFTSTFIVPDEANSGKKAKILCYAYDEESGKRVFSAKSQFTITNTVEEHSSTDKPQIDIWVDSQKFKPGDTVSSSPTIYARISDVDGININGEPGRKILLLMKVPNGEETLVDMTESFEYDENSYTSGELSYKLTSLSEGSYDVTLFAYDNYGDWNQKETYFVVRNTNDIVISKALVYPNPVGKEGCKFTFLLSEEGDVSIDVFTITGKKIIKLKKYGCNANYNELDWNGLDAEGDELANGTYFYRLKVKSEVSGKTGEKIGKFIVEK